MAIQLRAARIPLSQIDLDDATFLLAPPDELPPPGSLVASIERTCILHPPIIQEKAASSYRVVAGRNRLLAIRSNRPTGDCLVLAANTPPLETLATALEAVIIHRRPTAVEKGIFLQKALRWLDEKQVALRFLPLLGISADPSRLRDAMEILDLEEPLQLAVHHGRLDETVARDLGALSFGERMTLFDLIDLLPLSGAEQKELVAGCRQLARHHDTSIINVLSDPALRDILHDRAAQLREQAVRLLGWLAGKQLAELVATAEEWRNFCHHLELPAGVTLHHGEGAAGKLTLTIDFADRDRLLSQWPLLRRALAAAEG